MSISGSLQVDFASQTHGPTGYCMFHAPRSFILMDESTAGELSGEGWSCLSLLC